MALILRTMIRVCTLKVCDWSMMHTFMALLWSNKIRAYIFDACLLSARSALHRLHKTIFSVQIRKCLCVWWNTQSIECKSHVMNWKWDCTQIFMRYTSATAEAENHCVFSLFDGAFVFQSSDKLNQNEKPEEWVGARTNKRARPIFSITCCIYTIIMLMMANLPFLSSSRVAFFVSACCSPYARSILVSTMLLAFRKFYLPYRCCY